MTDAVLSAHARTGIWARIGEDVESVFHRDPAARSRFDVYLTYPGVHAVILYLLAHPLWRRGLHLLARFVSYIARIWTSIDNDPGATIGRRFFTDHGAHPVSAAGPQGLGPSPDAAGRHRRGPGALRERGGDGYQRPSG